MKKRLTQIILPIMTAAVLVNLSACAQKEADIEIDMAKVIEANNTENLLKNYGSFLNILTDENGAEYYSIYVDNEIYYCVEPELKQITGDDFQFICDNGTYYGNLICDGSYNDWYANILLSDSTADEKVLSATDNGTIITVVTELDENQTAGYADSQGETYQAGDIARIKYQLDSRTLALISCEDELIHTDGTTSDLGKSTVTYGIERSDDANQMLERAKPTADIRTLTVVLDPNTESEQVFTKTVRKGDIFSFICPDGYELYSDEACTVPYVSDDSGNYSRHILLFAAKVS